MTLNGVRAIAVFRYCWSDGYAGDCDNISINVYGAIIMTTAIARVHPIQLISAHSVLDGRQPSNQADRLGL